MTRIRVTWLAIRILWIQTWLWLDQGCNAVLLGLGGVFIAFATAEEQATCYADETLSAHAWRASRVRKPWAVRFLPVVDWMFRKQKRRLAVDHAAGRPVESHCERAFWAKKLRLGLPPEYR